jgi:hypothetical protein
MLHDIPAQEAEYWHLDQEIEQIRRLLKVWESQAQLHFGTPFGEIIESIAHGYVVQLDDLHRARECAAKLI